MRSVPSGDFIIFCTKERVPSSSASFGPGSSTCGSFTATRPTSLSPDKTWSISLTERDCPTARGTMASGKTTVSLRGSMGMLLGVMGESSSPFSGAITVVNSVASWGRSSTPSCSNLGEFILSMRYGTPIRLQVQVIPPGLVSRMLWGSAGAPNSPEEGESSPGRPVRSGLGPRRCLLLQAAEYVWQRRRMIPPSGGMPCLCARDLSAARSQSASYPSLPGAPPPDPLQGVQVSPRWPPDFCCSRHLRWDGMPCHYGPPCGLRPTTPRKLCPHDHPSGFPSWILHDSCLPSSPSSFKWTWPVRGTLQLGSAGPRTLITKITTR